MRNKAKNVRMNVEVTPDVETPSYMKFSLTVRNKIRKNILKERDRENYSQLYQIYNQLSVDFKLTSKHLEKR